MDLSTLNPPQREAVQHREGPLLVLAGAGTGKTRVITYRIAQLIENGTPPESILSVTFTNKAAREMRERMKQLVQFKRGQPRPTVSTFHSLCVRILRDEIDKLGYPKKFTIADRGDQESTARNALREIRVPDQQMSSADLVNQISNWKSAGIAADRAAASAEDDLESLAAMGYRKYQEKLQSSGTVDFDDILLLVDRLFTDHPDVLERQRDQFQQIQIDEYQDTNGIQFRLIQQLAEGHRNLCVVGDDDQSIYGWRGADVTHILSFPKHYPDATVVRLEDNYRCTGRILGLANNLVARNKERHKKTLRAAKSKGEMVEVREYPDEAEEAMEIAREIKFYHEVKKVPLRDFAILFRTKEQPRPFESELRRAGLRYVIMGAQSFFDRREVKDTLAYLSAATNEKDEMSMLRVINRPARGLGDKTVKSVLDLAVRHGEALWDAIPRALEAKEISPRGVNAFTKFRETMEACRAVVQDAETSLADRIARVLELVDYQTELNKNYDDPEERTAREGTLNQLKETAADYEATLAKSGRKPTMDGFLHTMALDGRELSEDRDEIAAEDAIKLMTLHSAKGLEFPRVYLVGLEEGLLPHKRSVDAGGASIEEERRLAYVGVTRAQDRLCISRAEARRKWGKLRKSRPSRFLREMLSDD